MRWRPRVVHQGGGMTSVVLYCGSEWNGRAHYLPQYIRSCQSTTDTSKTVKCCQSLVLLIQLTNLTECWILKSCTHPFTDQDQVGTRQWNYSIIFHNRFCPYVTLAYSASRRCQSTCQLEVTSSGCHLSYVTWACS